MNQIDFIHKLISVFASSFGHNDPVLFQLSSIVVNILLYDVLLYILMYRSEDLHMCMCAPFFSPSPALFH
jgi:hypothetical protein